jgi:hypothetical protein
MFTQSSAHCGDCPAFKPAFQQANSMSENKQVANPKQGAFTPSALPDFTATTHPSAILGSRCLFLTDSPLSIADGHCEDFPCCTFDLSHACYHH